ncbi:glycosyltransferase family A protein [Phenylobacterium sp.]|uniref:glycosyltransferase family A protein n=1 Tax=Phenylobacterium sp. TaxID=1871053 RepID=UPI003983125C
MTKPAPGAELKAERARARAAEADLARAHAVIRAQAEQISAVHRSTSWRVTRPLRVLVRLLRGQTSLSQLMRRIAPALLAPLDRALTMRRQRVEAARLAAVTRPQPRAVAFPGEGDLATLPELTGIVPEPLAATVSVIIPTYNAGPEFAWLLRKLSAQQGLARVEIVVVDSGSTDGTWELAQASGCKVIRIPNSEFSHSHARNLGADNAAGDLFLFTVQDAYPIGDFWLQSLARALISPRSEDQRVAAVSCSELPRRDSELLYNAGIDTHYRFLGCDSRDRIGAFTGEDNQALRTQGQLSDVACMIPAGTFHVYRYQGRYAEDLLLGVRLIRDGLRTAMLSSVKVIHSHNRPAAYHLKRTFVDVVFLTEVFPDFAPPLAESVGAAVAAAAALDRVTQAWRPLLGADAGLSLRRLVAQARAIPLPPLMQGAAPDFGFAPLAGWLKAALAVEGAPDRREGEQVRTMFVDRLEGLAAFCERTYGATDAHLADELCAAARKTLAATVGAQLAFFYLHQSRLDSDRNRQVVAELRDLMLAGV